MKKVTTIVAGFSLLLAMSAFTPSATVSFKIKSAFEESFAPVADVKWKAVDGIYVASFKDNNHEMAAAYSEDGVLLCVATIKNLSEVPFSVTRSLRNKYAGYKINPEVIEVSAELTTYIIKAENEKVKLKLISDASGNITIDNKTKKK